MVKLDFDPRTKEISFNPLADPPESIADLYSAMKEHWSKEEVPSMTIPGLDDSFAGQGFIGAHKQELVLEGPLELGEPTGAKPVFKKPQPKSTLEFPINVDKVMNVDVPIHRPEMAEIIKAVGLKPEDVIEVTGVEGMGIPKKMSVKEALQPVLTKHEFGTIQPIQKVAAEAFKKHVADKKLGKGKKMPGLKITYENTHGAADQLLASQDMVAKAAKGAADSAEKMIKKLIDSPPLYSKAMKFVEQGINTDQKITDLGKFPEEAINAAGLPLKNTYGDVEEYTIYQIGMKQAIALIKDEPVSVYELPGDPGDIYKHTHQGDGATRFYQVKDPAGACVIEKYNSTEVDDYAATCGCQPWHPQNPEEFLKMFKEAKEVFEVAIGVMPDCLDLSKDPHPDQTVEFTYDTAGQIIGEKVSHEEIMELPNIKAIGGSFDETAKFASGGIIKGYQGKEPVTMPLAKEVAPGKKFMAITDEVAMVEEAVKLLKKAGFYFMNLSNSYEAATQGYKVDLEIEVFKPDLAAVLMSSIHKDTST